MDNQATLDELTETQLEDFCWIFDHWLDPYDHHGQPWQRFQLRETPSAGRVRLEQTDPACNGHHFDAPGRACSELDLKALQRQRLTRHERVRDPYSKRLRTLLELTTAGEAFGYWFSGAARPIRTSTERPLSTTDDNPVRLLSLEAHEWLVKGATRHLETAGDDLGDTEVAHRCFLALQQFVADLLQESAEGDSDEMVKQRMAQILDNMVANDVIGDTQRTLLKQTTNSVLRLIHRKRHPSKDSNWSELTRVEAQQIVDFTGMVLFHVSIALQASAVAPPAV